MHCQQSGSDPNISLKYKLAEPIKELFRLNEKLVQLTVKSRELFDIAFSYLQSLSSTV